MFTEALSGNTENVLALLGESLLIKDFYLAGGTAAALQLGHRISYDLDFYSPKNFDSAVLAKNIDTIARFNVSQVGEGTVLGNLNSVNISLFYYPYPLLFPVKKFHQVSIADIKDIAAMKIGALSGRGRKRDFIDLYFICRKVTNLEEVLRLYDRKYKNLASISFHIRKSLTYFADAEDDSMPDVLKEVTWKEVKKFFWKEALNLPNGLFLDE